MDRILAEGLLGLDVRSARGFVLLGLSCSCIFCTFEFSDGGISILFCAQKGLARLSAGEWSESLA